MGNEMHESARRAMSELDALSENWSVETALSEMARTIAGSDKLAERIEALARLAFEEGYYRCAIAQPTDAGVGREAIAAALADRFIERGSKRVAGSKYSSLDDMPGSYRNDFLADADAILALFEQGRK